jgi:hypothetical protein
MRKLLTWLVVTLGIAALVRKLRRREEPLEHAPAPAAPSEDPAAELRRKLDESRTEETTAAADSAEGAETSSAVADASVEERRAEVHDQGRATLQEMQPPDAPSGASPETPSEEQ